MGKEFEADYAISLSKWDLVPGENINKRYAWTGWQRRHWPAVAIRTGTVIYGFDGRREQRRLCYLLKVRCGGGFTYTSKQEFARKVKMLTGWSPAKSDPHWDRIPKGTKKAPATGFAIRWKMVRRVNIPHPKPFPQLGWERLSGSAPLGAWALDAADLYDEGRRVLRTHLTAERNVKLRRDSKAYWHAKMGGKLKCIACHFDFAKRYGALGEDFIEMHHIKPLAKIKRKTRKGVTALLPVCSNCHRMIHKGTSSIMSVTDLKKYSGTQDMTESDSMFCGLPAVQRSHMTEQQYVHWAVRQEFGSEWVDGTVVLHAPIGGEHDRLQGLLRSLLGLHVEKYDLGRVHGPQFQIRLPRPSRRQPDVLFVSKPRLQLFKPMYLAGAPDLAIEIVSPDTESRDRREKYFEYQAAGVREYWIVDPASQHVEVYTLGSDQTYALINERDGKIASNIVPDWYLKRSWLWQQPRPSLLGILAELGVT